nr:MAG TPA: hypothetical protein [Caudoviricetes sp.]
MIGIKLFLINSGFIFLSSLEIAAQLLRVIIKQEIRNLF